MSRNDEDDQARYRTRDEQIRERNARAPDEDERRGPYQAQRNVRTFGPDAGDAAEHPWRAAHPHDEGGRGRAPRWSEQPARYGGGYDDELSAPRGERGDARYGLDTRAERRYGERYGNEGDLHAHGYDRREPTGRGQRAYGHGHAGQNNSGYDREREYGQGNERDDARSDLAHASWTQEHDYQGPRYASHPRDDVRRGGYGGQYGHTDIYGGAGFRQEGKRYWFDESDQRAGFRGTSPRGYQRSDERLRELACERLTDADLDASDIEVKVSQGVVTLEGSVRARWMKHQAEDIIDDIGGVKDIQNHLRVGSGLGTGAQATANTGTQATTGTTTTTGGGTTGGTGPIGGDIGGRSKH